MSVEAPSVSPEATEVGDEATERVSVRLTCRTVSDMRKLAHQHNRTFSGEVRNAIALYIAQYKKRAGA